MRTSHAIKAVLSLGTLSGALWAGTFADFSDTQTAASSFTAGTVDLRLNSDATSAYGFTSLNLSNMKPGDDVYAPLTVTNNGTLPYTYVMTSASTNGDSKNLRTQMLLAAKLVTDTGLCTSGGFGGGTNVIASGTLNSAAISSARTLAAAGSEILCFHVTFPGTADNTYQGATTTTTMTFTASQV